MTGVTLDAGALIALDRGRREVIALLARVRERKGRVTIPATALAQALRSPVRQVRLARLLRDVNTDISSLDRADATAVGLILARTGATDIADAHVAHCAQRANQPVLTSDPADLLRLAPELSVHAI